MLLETVSELSRWRAPLSVQPGGGGRVQDGIIPGDRGHESCPDFARL